MKYFLSILFVISSLFVNSQNTYYMSPSGNDGNDGSIGSPWKTIEYSTGQMVAGDTLYLRGGTYRSDKATSAVNRFYIENLDGSSGAKFNILNYPGESPVFNCDEQLIPGTAGDGPVVLKIVNSDYIHIRGIRLTGLDQNPANINTPCGMIISNVDNSTVERFEIDEIQGYGFYFQDGSDNNLVKNTDVHNIGDVYSGWGGANGFNCTGGDASTNNTFRGCRTWWCSDDGYDLFGVNGVFVFDSCWSFWNGYQPGTFTTGGDGMGFKLGPTATNQSGNMLRTVTNCMAFENRVNGYDQNASSTTTCIFTFYNNTAVSNGSNGYFFGANTSIDQIFKNNINYDNGIWGDEIQTGPNVSHNTWNLAVTVTDADFVSVDATLATAARQSDGTLPNNGYLKLVAGSDLVEAGVDVGLPFSGSAPDLGAKPHDTSTPTQSGFKLRAKKFVILRQ